MKTEYFDLKNKRALISGGASGIGSSIVEHLCEQGVEVYFFDIDKKEAKKLLIRSKRKNLKFQILWNVTLKILKNINYQF